MYVSGLVADMEAKFYAAILFVLSLPLKVLHFPDPLP